MKRLRILNLTPIKHIDGLEEFLSDYFEMANFENVRKDDEIKNRVLAYLKNELDTV